MITETPSSETIGYLAERRDDVTPAGPLLRDGTQQLGARFVELAELREDWDGYGALPVDRQALIFAARLVRDTVQVGLPMPEVFPVPDGGVQLEWTAGPMELELEIEPGARGAVFVGDDSRSGRRFDGELPRDMSLLRQAVSTLGVRLRERDG